MSTVQGNYMSDAAIMAWVAEQQNRLYGDLHVAMDFEELRSGMASDVSDLKGLVQRAGEDVNNLPALGAGLQEFRTKYGNVPEFQELMQVVDDILRSAGAAIDAATSMGHIDPLAAAIQNVSVGLSSAFHGPPLQASSTATNPGAFASLGQVPTALSKEDVDRWVKVLGEKVDASNNNQQIGMIHIGEIKSTIDQGSNLASQLVKSGNDTTSSIINNF